MTGAPNAHAHDALAPLIAIVGCDGSGKSTVSAELLAWLQRQVPAEMAHLGKQSGNIGRAIARWPLIGGWLDRRIARKVDSTRKERGERNPGLLTALVVYALSMRRVPRFRRMLALRRRGLIVLTDRYPQLEVPGAYDGADLSTVARASRIVRWLAQRERRHFEWMTGYRPDLVLRLNVDLDTACARKPDHRRSLLAEKIAVTPLLTFAGAPIVEIDASRPLPAVLADARAAIADLLGRRGYRLDMDGAAGQ